MTIVEAVAEVVKNPSDDNAVRRVGKAHAHHVRRGLPVSNDLSSALELLRTCKPSERVEVAQKVSALASVVTVQQTPGTVSEAEAVTSPVVETGGFDDAEEEDDDTRSQG